MEHLVQAFIAEPIALAALLAGQQHAALIKFERGCRSSLSGVHRRLYLKESRRSNPLLSANALFKNAFRLGSVRHFDDAMSSKSIAKITDGLKLSPNSSP